MRTLFIKNIGILTHSQNNTTDWENNCFSEYGVKPVFIRNEHFLNRKNYDVIADFEEIDDNKLHLNVSGEEAILYPFFKFLEVPEELKILENLDLSKTTSKLRKLAMKSCCRITYDRKIIDK